MLQPPYPTQLRLGDASTTASPVTSHWEPAVILLGGGLTITGLILQAKGAKETGTLLFVSAILLTTTVAAIRCYR